MIARTWHGAVPADRADEYQAYLARTGLPDLTSTPGNLGVYVLRRLEGDEAHFLLVSLWRSREDIRAFAGDDIDRARYYPDDTDFLLELEPHVTHYDVLGHGDVAEPAAHTEVATADAERAAGTDSPDRLAECTGRWEGTSRLQDPAVGIRDDSRSTLELAAILGGKFVRADYTWAYHGEPQQGSLLIGREPGSAAVTAHWIDSWHMGHGVMACRGSAAADGSIDVRGVYAAPPGPDWGWRVVLRPEDATTLRLVMYNIHPDGREELAVEADYTRAG